MTFNIYVFFAEQKEKAGGSKVSDVKMVLRIKGSGADCSWVLI